MLDILRERRTDGAVTYEIAIGVAARLKIDFASTEDFWRWEHNSISKQLKVLMKRGVVQRTSESSPNTYWGVARWWLRSDADVSADGLLQQLAAAGEEVHESDTGSR